MMSNIYGSALARVYDILNSEVDYNAWAGFVKECISRYSSVPVKTLCEVGCGTGSLSVILANDYSVTACDFSEDMLTEAELKARSCGADVRFVLQDMRYTEMYSRKDCFVCSLDGINYLTKKQDVISAFSSINKNLTSGGLFIFDINSKFKFENIYADNHYVLEDEGIYCGWENSYNPSSRICDFYLSVFTENDNGSYTRCDEHQREKMYTVKQIKSYLEQCGFSCECVCGGLYFEPSFEDSQEKVYFIAKKQEEI